ncbi:MAG: acyl-CoA dehydrogenase family protein [Chloroflexi bacterium]|nr:acyl-CoA dehydrogenase family protein [Chloroflexota bacterium]
MLKVDGSQAEQHEQIVSQVRRFVDEQVIPVAQKLEHDDVFPGEIVEQMKDMGIFAVTIPQEWGGLGLPYITYVAIVEELARGWMSIGGVINTHMIGAHMINLFGTQDQKQRFLPRMATGEIRAALTITEPNAGSDVQAIRTRAVRDGDTYVLNGTKMFVTNGRRADIYSVLVKTDPDIRPAHRGMSMFIVEKEKTPGFVVGRDIEKIGYKGLDTTEILFDDAKVSADNLLGGVEGQGFVQAMSGLELGRVNVAGRAVGLARAAFEDAIRYAQQRETFGKPIAEHQAIQLKLAEMYTKITAARLLAQHAARKKDSGERADMEVGMAKLFATETALEVSLEAMRIHGGYGYTKDMRVERYYRDAPFMAIAEGTNEIQKTVIARSLLRMYQI